MQRQEVAANEETRNEDLLDKLEADAKPVVKAALAIARLPIDKSIPQWLADATQETLGEICGILRSGADAATLKRLERTVAAYQGTRANSETAILRALDKIASLWTDTWRIADDDLSGQEPVFAPIMVKAIQDRFGRSVDESAVAEAIVKHGRKKTRVDLVTELRDLMPLEGAFDKDAENKRNRVRNARRRARRNLTR